VHECPADLSDDDVRRALSVGWGVEAEVEYAAVGFGSHHWTARTAQARWFVTVDDLDRKPMLGASPDQVRAELARRHSVARRLHDSGLEFVVAPVPTAPGASTVEIAHRWAVSLLPWVEGTAWGFSDELAPTQRDELVGLLARLHGTYVPDVGLRPELPPSGRGALEALLVDDVPEPGGPHSAAAQTWLHDHRTMLRDRLAEVDAVAARIDPASLVVTHGEPHPGNLVGSADGLRLVDWDTVALAPRERDLWLVGTDEATVSAYESAAGVAVDRVLLGAYRLAWDLADVASFLDELRRPHDDTADTRAALHFLTGLELAPVE
jgi:spectinomycin phosphotransferase